MGNFINIAYLNLLSRRRGLQEKNLLLIRQGRIFRAALFLLGVFFGWGILLSLCLPAQAREPIRVLITRDVTALKISGEGLALQDLKTGQTFFKNKRFPSLVIEREPGSALRVREPSISAPGFLLESSNGYLWVNGRKYRDKIRLMPGQSWDVWAINVLPLEEYLVGLVNFEISSQWPMEAIKAQVVAARTYAVHQKGNRAREPYDVDSGVSDQVYGGVAREDARSRQAVEETRGEVILHQGSPIFAVYSACCGGRTEKPEHLWAMTFPYLKSLHCPYCLDSPHFLWNYELSGEQLSKALDSSGTLGSRILGIEIDERSETRRVLKLTLQGERGHHRISGKDFRRLLGYDLLRSTNFVVKEKGGAFSFSGLGWGHGVGLCQWGAKGLAEGGADYPTILKYYYQKVEIGKIR